MLMINRNEILTPGSMLLPELQLNKANAFNTEAAFLDLYLSIDNGTVSTN